MESNEMKWIDTHCHLYASEFDPDRNAMIQRAIGEGISSMMLPNIDLGSIAALEALVHDFPDHCFPMMGLHPCSVKEDYKSILSAIEKKLFEGNFVGIGETGIDLYWDTSFKAQQIEVFTQHMRWARELKLPVIIHSRESLDLNIELVRNQQDGTLKGIFHCFGGNVDQAKEIGSLGFKIGIGGVVTYKNSNLPEVLAHIDPAMMVLETDAPYLSPVPFRGKRNESAYLILVAQKLAEILQLDLKTLSALTSDNAREVFGKKG